MSPPLTSPLLCLVLVGATLGYVDFNYHNYEQLTNILHYVNSQYPNLTHVYSIGTSVMGRKLWAIAIGYPGTARRHRLLIPEVKLVANIHGNEPVGREMLLHLLDYLTTQYSINNEVKKLLQTSRIHLLPSMNPDGFEKATVGDCQGMRGRGNANGIDLNRNFPDYFDGNNVRRQPEATAIMNWLQRIPFILSASMHGGALVANYPYDNYFGGSPDYKLSKESRCPDSDIFRELALIYSRKNQKMYAGRPCPGDAYAESFQYGVTNGAAWYPLTGGMQDYNYIQHGCFELTVEMSCCKYPLAGNLTGFWALNRDAMIAFLQAAHSGIRGFVRNSDNQPIKNANVKVNGRHHDFKTTKDGEYWRLLRPGTYRIKASKKGYKQSTQVITISSRTEFIIVNFTLNSTRRGTAFTTDAIKLSAGSNLCNFLLIALCTLLGNILMNNTH